ncbi:RNA-binding protein [bacterium]|nr:RNA-binding protein [bacterium]
MNIYVGNLSFKTTEAELRDAFAVHGTVESARLVTDKFTGQPRGFGFVEMPDDTQARAAIAALDGKELGGRALRVNEAQPRAEGGGGGGGRGGYGGGGGGRSGGGGYGGGGGGRGGGGYGGGGGGRGGYGGDRDGGGGGYGGGRW